jgi:UDP-N-acetylglucosamine transferase subunit ALG13
VFVTVSTGYFDALIDECVKLADRYDFVAQIGSSTVVPPFLHYKTLSPEALDRELAGADIVVTHAGTGMLSRLYRLRKPAVVVPKQSRYGESNDGQVELAVRWAELGMAVLCLDVSRLDKAIESFASQSFTFPAFAPLGRRLNEWLDSSGTAS